MPGGSQPEQIRRAAERRSPPVGLPPPPNDHGMFAPARAGHSRRQLVISMPPTMVSLANQPPGGMSLRYKGAYQGPRWRSAVEARETGPVSITDGNSIPRSVIPITPITPNRNVY
jgi:hypothetical protein